MVDGKTELHMAQLIIDKPLNYLFTVFYNS